MAHTPERQSSFPSQDSPKQPSPGSQPTPGPASGALVSDAAVSALVVSGVFSIDQSLVDVGIVLIAGVVGYFMRWAAIPFLPMVLGVVLGYMVESNYRRSLQL